MTCQPLITTSLAIVLLGAVANAQSEPPALTDGTADAVKVSIGAVLASNGDGGFDHRLASMRRQFDSFFSYSSYRLMAEQHRRLPWGGKIELDIPGGRHVLVAPREFKNQRVVMKVVVSDGNHSIVDTLVALHDGGTFLVGGQRQPDGVMIVTIGAELLP